MPKPSRIVIGGIDTHSRTDHAAVLDTQGRLLGDREFPADRDGYRQLLCWLVATARSVESAWRVPAATAPA
jgi:transposase